MFRVVIKLTATGKVRDTFGPFDFQSAERFAENWNRNCQDRTWNGPVAIVEKIS